MCTDCWSTVTGYKIAMSIRLNHACVIHLHYRIQMMLAMAVVWHDSMIIKLPHTIACMLGTSNKLNVAVKCVRHYMTCSHAGCISQYMHACEHSVFDYHDYTLATTVSVIHDWPMQQICNLIQCMLPSIKRYVNNRKLCNGRHICRHIYIHHVYLTVCTL